MPSRLLDMRECAAPEFRNLYEPMRALDLNRQPAWFRPLLRRHRRLRSMTGYDHWSRAWEYPWAVIEAGLVPPAEPVRILDVGGGGSPFAPWLASQGHEAHVADPSLDQGRWFAWDPTRGVFRNGRTLAKQAAFRLAGIRTLWGLPKNGGGARLRYHAVGGDALGFPDAHFDRVFCLSVIEHVPRELWAPMMREMARVVRPGGRLVMTMDLETSEADARLYQKLIDACPLRLVSVPQFAVPIDPDEAQRRHPGNWYETLGLVWMN